MWGTMMSQQLTLGSILERAGSIFGEREVVSYEAGGTLDRRAFGDIAHNARALAEMLVKNGLRRGERVGTLMYNHRVHLEAYFGVTLAGGVVNPINIRLHPNDIEFIIRQAEDRFLIVDSDLLFVVEQVRAHIECERIFLVTHSRQETVSKGYHSYDVLLAPATGHFAAPSLHENEAAVLCYTSGTAGRPKGIAYSHRALVLHSLAISMPDAVCISQNDTVMPIVPMYHANAWGMPLAAILTGAKLVFAASDTCSEALLDLMEAEQVTLAAAVPSVWTELLHALERGKPRQLAPGARGLVSGAAPAERLFRHLDRYGIRLTQAWGLVESGPLATIAIPHSGEGKSSEESEKQYEVRATQGKPLPLVELRVVGAAGAVPRDGKTMGEAQLRGPWVAGSYYNVPELRGKWTDDGWFRTGDVVTVDATGNMKIADRAKDLIRSGDDWISSVDLESALMGHPAVLEAAVVAVAHANYQERPLAVLVLKSGEAVQPDELRAFLLQKFAAWQLPDAFVFVSELPHTPTGKLLKKELRMKYKNYDWEGKSGSASE